MFEPFIRKQLIVLTAISVAAIATLLLAYVKLPTVLGLGQETVTARFADGANLYANANVTYRGYTIGKVEKMSFPPPGQPGVDVVMSIDDSQDIPVDSVASIHSVSAIGEQYVDFVPRGDPAGAPFLTDGAFIPLADTTVPRQIAPVLQGLQNLLASVPRNSLQTVVRELGTAFDGTGPDLRRTLENISAIVSTADDHFQPTQQLIHDLGPLLQTQIDTAPQIRDWTRDLALLTDTLRARDPELRSILDHVPAAAQAVDGTLRDLRPTLPILLNNLVTVGDLLAQYNPTLEQVLVVYPKLVATEQASTLGGGIGLDIATQVENPRPCYAGYAPPGAPDGPRPPEQLADAPTKPNSFCKIPQDDPRVVRGARNLPCLEGPPGRRAPSPGECRTGRLPVSTGAGVDDPTAPTTPQSATLDDGVTPDDPLFVLGGVGDTAGQGKDATWQRLLQEPLTL